MLALRRQVLARPKELFGSRSFGGDIGRGSGKFGEREHAQEEQYFRKKVPALCAL